jgi:ABC-type Zn uptake system ZnuABC Zn-binding protein ZnuA
MKTLLLMLAMAGFLARPAAAADAPARPLRLVATTTFVADTVRRVAGPDATLAVLLPPDLDPHAYEPSPRDAVTLAGADVVFQNGLGLEHFLADLLRTAGEGRAPARIISVSDGIAARRMGDHGLDHEEEHGHEHGELDPHVWLNPLHVATWTRNIERTLAELDPAHATAYAERAAAYRAELEALDERVRQAVAAVPESQRRFVTDHEEFGYFAERYGFEVVGAIIPSVSTLAEPSARDLAGLERALRASGTRVIVVGAAGHDAVAQRLAGDTGARVVPLYTCALGGPGSPAATYVDYLELNVRRLVAALQDAP